jgi:hypothetical protein
VQECVFSKSRNRQRLPEVKHPKYLPLSLSKATTLPIPSTSQAYLRDLNPEADNACVSRKKVVAK